MSEHAISNARGWAEIIRKAMVALATLRDGEAESVTYDGETFDDEDTLRERIEQMPLSLQIRDGWRSPGEERADPEEFELLLSTGGPTLRIYGDIGGPHSLQWQDWGTPWTDYRETSDEQDEAINAFVGMFYFGD